MIGIQWSEPFRLEVGATKPAVYQIENNRDKWDDGQYPGDTVNWQESRYRYRIPIPTAVPDDDKWEYFTPTGEDIWQAGWQADASGSDGGFVQFSFDIGTSVGEAFPSYQKSAWRFRRPKHATAEMTQAIWDSTSREERIAYNRPAKDALWDKPTEYFTNGRWALNGDESLSLAYPHRVKPSPPPKPRYWLVTGINGVQFLKNGNDDPMLLDGQTAVELVEKGSA